ncbi:Cytochrome P450, family 706, subfamily A, polypeptide 6, putative [Theobroma cacao]|uniref:Cytochrome P450, family 706, subfamily A, polypeptide 6, putative n=1 Tax=Theobroma cacao TaxID=3641 RepID=A0A061G7B4_THECC|nr:Cytochrome P450, family 706, subfamily A, polypeptide 6, putative [Theobroma cacao]
MSRSSNSFGSRLAIACYAWWVKKFTKNVPPLPPGPPGLPILGNLPFLQPDLHRYFTKLSQIYGPIIKLQLGSKTCIVVSSASVAKEVLKDHDAIFANRDPPTVAIIGTYGACDMVWRPNGPEWRKLRRLVVSEIMSNRSLDDCYALRRREVRAMVKDIYGKVGSPVNIGDQMFLTSLDVILSVLWGGSLHGEERSRLGIEFRQFVVEFVELLGAPNISDLFPFLTRFDLQGYQTRMEKASTWFDEIFESVIAHRIKFDQPDVGEGKKKEQKKDFLQLLMELNQQGDYKSSLSKSETKALLLDVIIAGTDATSISLEWAMTELLRHPDKMRRAVEELDSVVGDQNIVEEFHIPQLVYLNATVKETFRFHPPIPLLVSHRPSATCTVAGHTIPKDSRVLLNAWMIQRDPEFWEHPLRFEPERFLQDAEKGNYQGNNFHFIPFGSGRRICAGIPLADKMVTNVLATLLHSFEWKTPDGTKPDIHEKFGFALKKTEPLVAIPAARLSNSEQYQ